MSANLECRFHTSPDGVDWVNEQYVGTSFTDTEWAKDTNWEQIPNQNQITELTDYVLKIIQN